MPTARIQYLVDQYFASLCTPEEKKELASWVAQAADDEDLKVLLEGAWEKHAPNLLMPDEMSDRIVGSLFVQDEELMEESTPESDSPAPPVRRIYFPGRYWWAAASVLIVAAGFSCYVSLFRKPGLPTAEVAQYDAMPGKNAAVLTIAGGKQILLDSGYSGTVSRQGNTTVVNAHGQLAYNLSHEKPKEILHNTLTTRRGNQYKLVLPDGTRVWLNAASSITYPTVFTGKERKVEITGEAYFEVVANSRMPFKVSAAGQVIEDLGTAFNINAYTDEPVMKTTLVEGSVKIDNVLLVPGEQANIGSTGTLDVVRHADIEEVMAWKNGFFDFKSLDIDGVARQLSRWYDMDVVFEGKKPEGHFSAMMNRNANASTVLKGLEFSGIHVRIDDKKIIIMP